MVEGIGTYRIGIDYIGPIGEWATLGDRSKQERSEWHRKPVTQDDLIRWPPLAGISSGPLPLISRPTG